MTLIDSYSEANQDDRLNINIVSPSDTVGRVSEISQSFTMLAGGNYNLTSMKFYLRKIGSPTGTAYMKLFAHTGTYGTSSLPTGSVLGTSAGLDISTLDGAYTLYELLFSGAEQYEMVASTYYVATFGWVTSGTLDTSNYMQAGMDVSSPTHSGNAGRYSNGAWGVYAAYDFIFYVYGSAVVGGVSIPVAMHHYGHHINKIIRG